MSFKEPDWAHLSHADNLVFALLRQAAQWGNKPALVGVDKQLGYTNLVRRVADTAAFLHRSGVEAGQAVALSFTDPFLKVVYLLAVNWLGASVFSLPVGAVSEHRQRVLVSQAGVRSVITDSKKVLYEAPSFCPVVITAAPVLAAATVTPLPCPSPGAPALLIAGSGTTGLPRLIPVSHGQMQARVAACRQRLGMKPDDYLAELCSMDFADPKRWLWQCFDAGAAFVVAPAVEHSLRSGQLTFACMTVFYAEKVLSEMDACLQRAWNALRGVCLGSATVTEDLRQRVRQDLCARLYIDYGSNEAGLLTILAPGEYSERPGAVGKALPGVDVQIVDADDCPLPQGEVGHIRCRCKGVFDGYVGASVKGGSVFKSGWYDVGDLGWLAADGQLFLSGRSDDLMIMNGINIYPADIEHPLTRHPDVRDAVVVAFGHPIHQDVPLAAVQLSCSAKVAGIQARLLAYARQNLGSHAPAEVVVLDAIPRNLQGKVDRRALREQVFCGLAGWGGPLADQRVEDEVVVRGNVVITPYDFWPVESLSARGRQLASRLLEADREIERAYAEYNLVTTVRSVYHERLKQCLCK